MTVSPLPPKRPLRPARLALALALCFGFGLALPDAHIGAALAQDSQDDQALPTALLADSVSFDGTVLIATGAVEVIQGNVRLTASRITFNQSTGQLQIDGPIRLTESGGDTVILASSADLDTGLKNGIMTSARMVVDRQLQLAAARLDVVDGRYLRLSKTVASTCEVCAAHPVPLWAIRASEVIHDSEAHQLYFTNAQLRIADVPVLWLPHLRVPDPTLKRARGFLIPELRTDSTLGTGIETPYFIPLGDSRDLTISPYIATKTTTLGLRYRQAFARGEIEVNGAVSADDTRDGTRAYLFAEGTWHLGNGFEFGADLRAASDIAYLVDYGIYDGDFLPSKLTLTRYSKGEAFDAQLIHMRTLRAADLGIEDTLPFFLGEVMYERRVDPGAIPGALTFGLSASSSYRDSEVDIDGYDVLRLGAEAAWITSAVFGPGLKWDSTAAAYVDAYTMHQNSTYEDTVARFTGSFESKLSWPLTRTTATGASELIEPMIQLGWSDSIGGDVPNTDSTLVEFDEGNLMTLARFPGADRRATGVTAAAGLHFAHYAETTQYEITLGRVLYLDDSAEYSDASGLSTTQSDWLLGASIAFDAGFDTRLAFQTRSLFDDAFDLAKWETRLDYMRPRYTLGASYAYVVADAMEHRDTALNEFGFDGSFRLAKNWSANLEYLYDFTEDEATRTGLGLQFENECARVRFKVSRRYSDTEALDPTTSYSLSIGFGAYGANGKKDTSCGFGAL